MENGFISALNAVFYLFKSLLFLNYLLFYIFYFFCLIFIVFYFCTFINLTTCTCLLISHAIIFHCLRVFYIYFLYLFMLLFILLSFLWWLLIASMINHWFPRAEQFSILPVQWETNIYWLIFNYKHTHMNIIYFFINKTKNIYTFLE